MVPKGWEMSARRVSRFLVFALLIGMFSGPLSAARAEEHIVSMVEHEFIPPELNITVGDTVTWRNDEPHDDDHTVNSLPTEPLILDSPQISRGETWSFQFNQAGDYPYYCEIHGFEMSGIIRVREPGDPFAADDVLALTKGSGPATGTKDVLENDEDPEEDPLRVTDWQETTARGATVSCTADGQCTYTQAAGAGCPVNDEFTYTISDGTKTDTATVEVSIRCGTGGGGGGGADTDVGMGLRRHLLARGSLTSTAGGCTRHRDVKVQRKTASGSWKTVARTESSDSGAYKVRVKDRPGKYRAKATPATLGSGQACRAGVSPTKRHRH
jgi:plastocyanin